MGAIVSNSGVKIIQNYFHLANYMIHCSSSTERNGQEMSMNPAFKGLKAIVCDGSDYMQWQAVLHPGGSVEKGSVQGVCCGCREVQSMIWHGYA